MIKKASKTVICNDKGIYLEDFIFSSESLQCESGGSWSIRKSRLKGGLSDGVDQVVIDNGHFSFSVLPSRGMGIFQGNCGGNFIGWSSPVGNPVNPSFINLFEPGDTRGWLKGFNECIVRCGLHSNGAACVDRIENEDGSVSETALNMHGLIANLPAKFVELQVVFSDPIELVVIGVVEEAAPFFPQYRLTTRISSFVGSSKINISESVENFGGTPAEFQMLYHCNFGAPFLEEGSKLVIPALETAPRDARAAEDYDTWDLYKAPEAGYQEQNYYHDLAADAQGNTLSMLRNKAGDKGVTLRWKKEQMPYFCQWKRTASANEGYVTGMEPATNFPNAKTFERQEGRVITLQPEQKYDLELSMEVQENKEKVQAIEKEISKIQGGKKLLLHSNPKAEWSPNA